MRKERVCSRVKIWSLSLMAAATYAPSRLLSNFFISDLSPFQSFLPNPNPFFPRTWVAFDGLLLGRHRATIGGPEVDVSLPQALLLAAP